MKSFVSSNILIKLADNEKELKEVFRLRYFDLILNYNEQNKNEEQMEMDEYDKYCDHLIAVDINTNKVVGTYRLITKKHLYELKTFLTETEFNLDPLKPYNILEAGRAVVDTNYRDGLAIALLWKGLIRYALEENMDYIIGTACFHGTDLSLYKDTFSFLYDKYLSPSEIRCYPQKDSSSELYQGEYNEEVAKKDMPPLIKGYLRLGATVGDGIYIDRPFNSSDVLIVLKIKDINPRYLKRYLE